MPNLSQDLILAVAVLAAAITWAQWYTARSKLVLDLFNQRMQIYDGACAVIATVMRAGTATSQDVVDLARQVDRSKFFFGSDVSRYLESVQKALAELGRCRSIIAQLKGDQERQKLVDLEAELLSGTVAVFFEEFPKLLAPYMRMHHRKPMWRFGEVMARVAAMRAGKADKPDAS
jgi:hypothetical protein